nr:exopolysaccharide biosynthesis protein [Micavibrio sp.]
PLPLTNTIPSLGIAMIGLGLVLHDGLAVIGGMVIGLLWIAMLVFATIYFGTEGIDLIKDFIKSFL